jgi:hypothetical protein
MLAEEAHPIKDFLVNNWGNFASVGGLIFSFFAFLFSRRASTAARQARDLALSRSLAQDMNTLDRSARDLLGDIDKERSERACERARDLVSDLQYLCARWTKLLAPDSKNNLMSAREHLSSVYEVLLSNSENAINAQTKPGLMTSALRTSEIFSKEHGTSVMASEYGEEPERE